MIRLAAIAAVLLAASSAQAGTPGTCPDLAQAKQVAECPDDGQLKRLFRSTCGVEMAPDAKNPDLCDAFTEFKRRKNNALWESADGEFMGYITCNRPADESRKAKAVGIRVTRRAKLTRVICTYDTGETLTMRTRSACTITLPDVKTVRTATSAKCGPNPGDCKFTCD